MTIDYNSVLPTDYAGGIVGKIFTIIQTPAIKSGDIVIRLNVANVGHEVPLTVKKVTKITSEFYEIEFVGKSHLVLPRFAHTCIFGRLNDYSNV